MKGPWPPWCDRDTDGRTLPPAPMPAELAATIDTTKRDTPGPVDEPTELARRIATLAEARARHPRPRQDSPVAEDEIPEMTDAETDWAYWVMSQDVDTGGRCTCGHEGLGIDWHLSGCPGVEHALRQKVHALLALRSTS